MICRDCTVVDHPAPSHTLVNLEKATKGQRTEIEQLARSCEEIEKKIDTALKEVDSVSEQLERNAATAEEEIDEAFNRALKLLEDNRKKLKGEVKTTVLERMKQCNAHKDEIQFQRTRLLTTLQMATEVVQTGSEYDLALVYSSLKTNLRTLFDMKPMREKKNLGDMSFKPSQTSQQATQNLGFISTRCRRIEGNSVWKLEKAFTNSGAGKLSGAWGVAITQHDDIAVADQGDSSVKFYRTKGDFKSKFKVPGNPWNIAVSTNGRMFITNKTNHVSVYDVEGNLKQQFPAKSPDNVSSDAQNTQLYGLSFDNKNNLLVDARLRNFISKHRLDGTHIMSVKVTIQPWYIAVSPQDKIIIYAYDRKSVHVVDENGVHLHTLQPPQGLSSWSPAGVCCSSDDEVYVADRTSGQIHSYSTETGDYIGCIIEDVTNPAGLALMDEDGKPFVVEKKAVKIFQLQ